MEPRPQQGQQHPFARTNGPLQGAPQIKDEFQSPEGWPVTGIAYCIFLNRCRNKNIYFKRLKSICEIYVFARLVKPFITYPNCQMFPFVAYFISNGWIKRSCLLNLTNIYFPIAIFDDFYGNFGIIQQWLTVKSVKINYYPRLGLRTFPSGERRDLDRFHLHRSECHRP